MGGIHFEKEAGGHKDFLGYGQDMSPVGICGAYSAYYWLTATTTWSEVTCLRCLKKKPTQRLKEKG